RVAKNAFDRFTFSNPFSSIPSNPATGVAHASEGTVSAESSGSYSISARTPSAAGVYWLDLGLAHGANWIYDGTVNNQCDSHARVTFLINVYAPQPVYRTSGGSYPDRPPVVDPVDSYSGNFLYQNSWLTVPGRGLPFTWGATYNSISPTLGLLGYGWNFHDNWWLFFDAPGTVTVQNGDARMDIFSDPDGDGQFTPPAGVNRTLTRNADGTYTLGYLDLTMRHFDVEGRLLAIVDRNGNTTSYSYNTAGLLTQITDSAGRSYQVRYDPAGRHIVAFVPPFGQPWQYTYDSDNLIGVTDPDGKTTSYTYDANHRLQTITDQNNHLYLENRYDSQGRVEWQRSVDNVSTLAYSYATDGSGFTVVTDGRSNIWRYSYDSAGRVIEERDPTEKAILYGYDARGNRNTVTDRRGFTTSYSYNTDGTLRSVTDPLNHTSIYTYDVTLKVITSEQDALGRVTTHGYDTRGNRTKTTDAQAQVTSYDYNTAGQMIKLADAAGGVTTYSYDDAWGNQTSVTDPVNNVTRQSYTPAGRVETRLDPEGKPTRYAYDPLQQVISETNPLSQTISYSYDGVGNRTAINAPNAKVTRFTYDAKDRLVTVLDPANQPTYYAYDANNNRIGITNALSGTQVFTYNERDLLIAAQDQDGNLTGYEYDANGNRTALIDPAGQRTSFSYDKLNRLELTRDPLGRETRSVYDAVGNEHERIDAANNATRFTYDELNRLRSITDTLTGTVQYEYDPLGRRRTQTDANGHSLRWEYDLAGRLIKSVDALAHLTEYGYDRRGLLTRSTDADGRVTTRTYDDAGRLTLVRYPDGSVSYSYDDLNRLISMVDAAGTTHYSYDQRDALTSYTAPDGQMVQYKRDTLGRLKQLMYPGGDALGYTYTPAGRITALTDWAGRTISYTYTLLGLVERQTLPNGVVSQFSYDQAAQLTALSHTAPGNLLIASMVYTYNQVGDRTQVYELQTNPPQAPQTVTLALAAGWNFVGLPVTPVTTTLAEDLCKTATGLTQVVRWSNGHWNSHPCNTTLNNFALEVGRGYLVHSSTASTWSLSDTALPTRQAAFSLTTGWNDLVPSATAATAEQACQQINGLGANLAEVSRWSNGHWSSHPCTTTLNDFALSANQPVLVRALAAFSWTGLPSAWPILRIAASMNTYSYDVLRRLTSASYVGGGQASYTYDLMGNRTQMTQGGATTDYQYDEADRLTQAGGVTFTWDNAGRMTGRTEGAVTTAYQYDTEGRLTQTGDVRFSYDGAGRRLSMSAGGQTTNYLYDVAGQLPV
ncbi:MAG: DUF6531 domain-containing protein, partial [Chloroflexales bacterium]